MRADEREILGCLVRDVQSGVSIGWVRGVIFDPRGERVTELLVDPSGTPHGRAAAEAGQRMIGEPLYDPLGRWLGEIVDVVVGAESGRLQGVMVDRGPGDADFLPAYQGLISEQGRWTLLEDVGAATAAPASSSPPPDAADDWMVGQIAARRLADRAGRLIVDKGQRITAATVEHASRAGLLHLLDAEPATGKTS